jgi:hypothetical protein
MKECFDRSSVRYRTATPDMAEPLAVTMLRTKRDQIEGLIAHLEDRLKEARTDLVSFRQMIRLFSSSRMAPQCMALQMRNRIGTRGDGAYWARVSGHMRHCAFSRVAHAAPDRKARLLASPEWGTSHRLVPQGSSRLFSSHLLRPEVCAEVGDGMRG